MNLAELGSLAAACIGLLSLWINLRDKRFNELKSDMKEGFNKVDKQFERIDRQFEKIDKQFVKVDDQFKEIREDLSDIKERVSAIEMSTILLKFDYDKSSNPDNTINKRSQAMLDYHSKRRTKRIEEK